MSAFPAARLFRWMQNAYQHEAKNSWIQKYLCLTYPAIHATSTRILIINRLMGNSSWHLIYNYLKRFILLFCLSEIILHFNTQSTLFWIIFSILLHKIISESTRIRQVILFYLIVKLVWCRSSASYLKLSVNVSNNRVRSEDHSCMTLLQTAIFHS